MLALPAAIITKGATQACDGVGRSMLRTSRPDPTTAAIFSEGEAVRCADCCAVVDAPVHFEAEPNLAREPWLAEGGPLFVWRQGVLSEASWVSEDIHGTTQGCVGAGRSMLRISRPGPTTAPIASEGEGVSTVNCCAVVDEPMLFDVEPSVARAVWLVAGSPFFVWCRGALNILNAKLAVDRKTQMGTRTLL